MQSKIEWTQHTWNPVTGCSKISEGCQNCYAESMARRFGGENGFKVTLHPNKLDVPLYRKKSTTYFVCSMADLFHDDVPFEFIDSIFTTMALTPQHTYQVLTKRPERMRKYFKTFDGPKLEKIAQLMLVRNPEFGSYSNIHWESKNKNPRLNNFPLENVWLGVTAENKKEANHRIPILLDTPAALRFVSVEPMLEEIDLEGIALTFDGSYYPVKCSKCGESYSSGVCEADEDDFWCPKCGNSNLTELPEIDWIICGGESGQKARPLNPLWVKSLQEQCAKGDVPFFFKQWGEFTCKNGEMVRVGKKEAGYLIDGKECREMPKENLK